MHRSKQQKDREKVFVSLFCDEKTKLFYETNFSLKHSSEFELSRVGGSKDCGFHEIN